MRLAAFVSFLGLLSPTLQAADMAGVRFRVECDLGRDVGQSFGSLFELRSSQGRVIAGAGFQDVYNTRSRNDRHALQFFVRPSADTNRFRLTRLPHPDLDCGVYLFDEGADLYAWTSVRSNSVRRWHPAKKSWVAQLPPGAKGIRGGDGVMTLGDGRLVFCHDQVRYNDRVILKSKHRDYCYYYAQGVLFFYRYSRDTKKTTVHAYPWTPAEKVVDLSRGVVLKTKFDRETPFAWGQFRDQVLTVSNMGGIYVFENGRWRTLLAGDDKTSYQVYSMIQWYDRLLLAQYPTGNVFEYNGTGVPRRRKNFPPKLPEVSASARECQTLSIYRGELFAGVWPWAEIWRYDDQKWHSLGRGFTHPELTNKQVHPYEQHTKRFKIVSNHWGQRITSMIPQGTHLWMATSAKGTYRWFKKYDFLTVKQRREYGAVLKLELPGHVTAPIKWNGGKLRLTLSFSATEMVVLQDGKRLAAAKLPAGFRYPQKVLQDAKISWRKGIYGPFVGKLSGQMMDAAK